MKELLDNVSKFWSKYFKDVDVLHALHEGALSKISEFKQNSASYLLATGLDSIPTKLRREVKLLELEDSEFKTFFYSNPNTGVTANYLVYELGDTNIRHIPFLASSPSGEYFLENGVDYELFRGDSEAYSSTFSNYSLKPHYYYIIFSKDPRLNVNFRKESSVVNGLYVVKIDNSSASFSAYEEIEIVDSSGVSQKVVVAFYDTSEKEIYLNISTPLTSVEEAFKVVKKDSSEYAINNVSEFSYTNSKLQSWALNSYVDPYIMRDRYSHLHKTKFYESSETYRAFLTGLSLLKTSEFSYKNVKAAVCLCTGVPVFFTSHEQGDRIIRVEKTDNTTVLHTVLAQYTIPSQLTLRPEILADALDITTDGVSDAGYPKPLTFPQSFIFSELDTIISEDEVCIKSDKLSDTSWWDRNLTSLKFLEVPQELMISEPLVRRLVINHEYPNKIGQVTETSGGREYILPPAAIGDYSLKINDPTRNTIAYRLFKDFIKSHFVYVQLSTNFLEYTELSRKPSILEDLRDLLRSSCLPGSVVLLGPNLDADLEDEDEDGIPDLIDPEIRGA